MSSEKLLSEFEYNVIPHMDILYNFALGMTSNRNKANSLLKETYRKALWFFEKLERGTNYKMWLFRVMRNAYMNSYRKKSKELIEPNYDEIENFYEKIKASSLDNSFLEKEINNLSNDKISEVLLSLPEDLKIVIILCDIEKFSYEEIADFVDVPVGVVLSRLLRGRKMLFKKLYMQAEKKIIYTEENKKAITQKKLNELITSYVDGELINPLKINEIKDIIEKDRSLNFDYQAQRLMKLIVTMKHKIQPTPEKVRKKIIRKIKPSENFLGSFHFWKND